jgi:exopolysaccharide biosynthesis polyprenyl glycosylphosphotransferase
MTSASASFASGPRNQVIPLWNNDATAAGVSIAPRAQRYRRAVRRPKDPSQVPAKRVFDVCGALAAITLLSPLLVGVAVAIKLTSRGPVFFKQNRYGYRNQRFRIYKFRTMYSHLADRSGRQQTVDGDTRITPLGRLLRRTSIDELPQLLNVLKGDMSLVGPRPHVPGMLASTRLYEDLIPYYFQRHCVRPGLTGLAQVSGCRGSTAQATAAIDRIDYDLKYIETWSLWLDAKILIRTVRKEVLSGGS